MPWPLSQDGRVRRLPYALLSCVAFFVQHLVVFVAFRAAAQPLDADWRFFAMPLRSIAKLGELHAAPAFAAFVVMLAVAWALAALAFRRADDASLDPCYAALVIAPIIQLPVILILCLLPSRHRQTPAGDVRVAPWRDVRWPDAVQGVLVGTGLMVAAVALAALHFGTYGVGMFIVSPFVAGFGAGYVANRRADIGTGRTMAVVAVATTLGGVLLVAAALEGIVCIAMAAPMLLPVAIIGGGFGRWTAGRMQHRRGRPLMAVALLPAVFALEQALPSAITLETRVAIEIAAPADAIWHALVRMDPIDAAPALPFRLGVAYPTGAELIGEGVGAERRGHFSTGVAVERVVAWEPGRRLGFVVLKEPPSMRELSPYEHVHAPHVEGYFRTLDTDFELQPLANGGTRLTLSASHELYLDPVLYWLPMARWIIEANNERVLQHIRFQAERDLPVSE